MDWMERNDSMDNAYRDALRLLRWAMAVVIGLALVSSVADGAFVGSWGPLVVGVLALSVSGYVVISSARREAEPFEVELARLLDETKI